MTKEKDCYSATELQEFKALIEGKLKGAKEQLTELMEDVRGGSPNGTNDTANPLKMLEDGSEVTMKEEKNQLAGHQLKYIEQLERALVRIENKTYGLCKVTGKMIPKIRLLLVPHTMLSMEAKLKER